MEKPMRKEIENRFRQRWQTQVPSRLDAGAERSGIGIAAFLRDDAELPLIF
jgi:hypothetical protein